MTYDENQDKFLCLPLEDITFQVSANGEPIPPIIYKLRSSNGRLIERGEMARKTQNRVMPIVHEFKFRFLENIFPMTLIIELTYFGFGGSEYKVQIKGSSSGGSTYEHLFENDGGDPSLPMFVFTK